MIPQPLPPTTKKQLADLQTTQHKAWDLTLCLWVASRVCRGRPVVAGIQDTWSFQCSSFLALYSFFGWDNKMQPKNELHWKVQIAMSHEESGVQPYGPSRYGQHLREAFGYSMTEVPDSCLRVLTAFKHSWGVGLSQLLRAWPAPAAVHIEASRFGTSAGRKTCRSGCGAQCCFCKFSLQACLEAQGQAFRSIRMLWGQLMSQPQDLPVEHIMCTASNGKSPLTSYASV